MKFFLYSKSAVRTGLRGESFEVGHAPGWVRATSIEEAQKYANDTTLQAFPAKDGWHNHRFAVGELPLDHKIEIVRALLDDSEVAEAIRKSMK